MILKNSVEHSVCIIAAKNLLRPNESIEVFFNEVAVIYNQSMVFCPSAMLTTPELNEWRIELKTIHNVYAILLWRNGPLGMVF